MDPKLLEYFMENREKEFSFRKLKETCLAHGYFEGDVDEVIVYLKDIEKKNKIHFEKRFNAQVVLFAISMFLFLYIITILLFSFLISRYGESSATLIYWNFFKFVPLFLYILTTLILMRVSPVNENLSNYKAKKNYLENLHLYRVLADLFRIPSSSHKYYIVFLNIFRLVFVISIVVGFILFSTISLPGINIF